MQPYSTVRCFQLKIAAGCSSDVVLTSSALLQNYSKTHTNSSQHLTTCTGRRNWNKEGQWSFFLQFLWTFTSKYTIMTPYIALNGHHRPGCAQCWLVTTHTCFIGDRPLAGEFVITSSDKLKVLGSLQCDSMLCETPHVCQALSVLSFLLFFLPLLVGSALLSHCRSRRCYRR